MTSEEYNKLTPEEAYQGVVLCVRNCELHLHTGRALINDKEMAGIANSHCILAYEEAIKAVFLFFRATTDQLTIDVRKMFKSHAHKHEFGKDYFYSFYIDAMKLLTAFNQKIDFDMELNPDSTKEYLEAADFFQGKIKQLTTLNVDEMLPDIIKWFNKADQQKSRGFYVDYTKQNGWQSPKIITVEDYRFSLFIAESIGLLAKLFLATHQLKIEADDSPDKKLDM